MLHINCRSLTKNFTGIYALFDRIHVDVVAVTETWLTVDNVQNINIPGYNFIHRHRAKKPGGGVDLFIKNNIQFNELSYESADDDIYECIFAEICADKGKNIIVGSLYRAPNTSPRRTV